MSLWCGVGRRIAEKVKNVHWNPFKIYNDNVKDSLQRNRGNEKHHIIDSCRNRHQVSYRRTVENASHKLSRDEIWAVNEMAKLPSGLFVREVSVTPLRIIVMDPAIEELTKILLSQSNKDASLDQLIAYDTTFNLTDGYVSVLVARDVFLKGSPIYPIAYLIHDDKRGSTHKHFWDHMDEVLKI